MRKIINLFVLLAFLGISTFLAVVCAQENPGSDNSVQLYRAGELVGVYTGLSQAISEAETGDVIKLIDDISVSEESVIQGKSITIDGNNYTVTRTADITTITVNEDSSLRMVDLVITDNAVNFAPNRYDSLLKAKSTISLCLGGVNETRNESGDVTESVCVTQNVDTAKTNPQIYSVGNIYGENLTISNSLSNKGAAAIIIEKGGIEMINSAFIHNGSYVNNSGRGGAIRIGPNTATNIVDESPIKKILFSGCYFENNYGGRAGGALSIHYAPEIITINKCLFSGNTSYYNGGAIEIPNINGNSWLYLPNIGDAPMPVGKLIINDSVFYNNWVGNDGAAIENDDLYLEVNSSVFEHNYGTQPGNTSVGVISCQPGSENENGRGLIWREYRINNSTFKDSNVIVLGDHNMIGSYFVDNCIFENQRYVLLSYNGNGEIKNSYIKNSYLDYCGYAGRIMVDFVIYPYEDYIDRSQFFGESYFRLYNNSYSNDCNTNDYFQVQNYNLTTGMSHIIVENENDTKISVHRRYYDSADIQGTDKIYYGTTIDDGKITYVLKNKFYNFDEFNEELKNFSYGNSGYQLESGKAMLFYLDSGYADLWSGSISTTTNLYGKETNIHNITYIGMDGINFEGITHTYEFIDLDHTQYLTELTPYIFNKPSRNGYKFVGWFLDSGYTISVTNIESGTTGDIVVYAKWEKYGSSGGGGGGGGSSKPDTPKQDEQKPTETPQDDSMVSSGTNARPAELGENPESETPMDSSEQAPQNDAQETNNSPANNASEGQNQQKYSTEFQQAYEFARENGITTMSTIQKADMNGKLTRIQMAKMLSQYAINILGKEPDVSKGVIKFKDVTIKMDGDYNNGVTLAYQLGIMGQNMPNNKFRPNDEVSRAEFVTALSRLLYSTLDGKYESTPKYYINHMERLVKEGVITKDNPKMKELRGYVMIMLMRSAE